MNRPRTNGQQQQRRQPPAQAPPPNRGDAYEEPDEQQPEEQPRRPATEYRLGRVKAVVWLNETQLGGRHSVVFYRLYKQDGADGWLQTHAFNRDDLPLVMKVAEMAWIYIFGAMQSEGI